MKIAHLLPYSARFPLSKHNGRYEWALRLAKRQASDGHQVTVYSSPKSSGDSPIIWESPDKDTGSRDQNNQALIKTAFNQDHDIYHSHFDFLHYYLADLTDRPIVFTQHWFPSEEISEAARMNKKQNTIAVPSSNLMAAEDRKLKIASAEIIRQGINLRLFSTAPPSQVTDRLLFVGRIAPWKGALEAVQIARQASAKLDIIGKLNTTEHDYWEKIEPFIDGRQIRYLGPKSQQETAQYMARAKALIFPSQAPEAAPQVPIEAQACGTPVIISNVGATDEWIADGKTGFIARSLPEYLEAIENIDKIDRNDCRKFALQFDFAQMVAAYYQLYERLISK